MEQGLICEILSKKQVDGFQEYLDTSKSTMTYKQDFRPDVLVANTRVVKFGLNLTKANKMVLMEPDSWTSGHART